MTDKQIIINGCDVSGCKCFYIIDSHPELQECPYCKDLCKNNPNCHYKQLKRKEQECEELKKQACGLRPELKYIIDKTCCKYNISEKYYHEKIVEIINNLDKLKQTLTEIKEIAENGCYDDCGMPLDELSIILQKISEVIE